MLVLQVLLTGPSALAASVADKGDGTYSVSYTATVAGVYELRITIGGCTFVAGGPLYMCCILCAHTCVSAAIWGAAFSSSAGL